MANIVLPMNWWVGTENTRAVAPKYTAAWSFYGNSSVFQAMAFPNLERGD